jgi:predicted O-methyltransferase YrrM
VWSSERYNQEKRKEVEMKFKNEIGLQKVVINLGYSTSVVNNFEDSYFDWIYIDTNHSYETTKEELNLYSPKIKKGGIIAGHDYIVGYWNGLVKYGVIEAVNEFCICNDWELVYLTMENRDPRSFAIRKM